MNADVTMALCLSGSGASRSTSIEEASGRARGEIFGDLDDEIGCRQRRSATNVDQGGSGKICTATCDEGLIIDTGFSEDRVTICPLLSVQLD